MKKKTFAKAVGVCVSAAAASAVLTGCTRFLPWQNRLNGIYGPPPDEWFVVEENIPEDVYGPPPFEDEEEPDFDAEENLPAPVYGPPTWELPVTPAPGGETP